MKLAQSVLAVSALVVGLAGCASKQIALGPVDPSRLADGAYKGRFLWTPCEAKVCVIIRDGRVEQIKMLRHIRGKGQPGEGVLPKILSSQSTRVDAVTGATRSSLVIMGAVQKAVEASYGASVRK